MNNRIIKLCILIISCIFTYLVIYDYTNQINNMSNNTYEKKQVYISKQSDFIKQYIETLKNKNYEEGFNMLDSDTKESFNNDLINYTEYIKEKTDKINKTDNGIFINVINTVYLKSQKLTKYEVISKKYTYKVNDVIDYVVIVEQFNALDNINVIEYAPNKFYISLK